MAQSKVRSGQIPEGLDDIYLAGLVDNGASIFTSKRYGNDGVVDKVVVRVPVEGEMVRLVLTSGRAREFMARVRPHLHDPDQCARVDAILNSDRAQGLGSSAAPIHMGHKKSVECYQWTTGMDGVVDFKPHYYDMRGREITDKVGENVIPHSIGVLPPHLRPPRV